MKTVITYGTFDLLHVGHLAILERLRDIGDRLIVGVSTDEFNAVKGKSAIVAFNDRARLVASLRCVDLVIPESTWEQKIRDIREHDVAVFGIGEDWQGKFDFLASICEVVYLSRTPGVSTSALRIAASERSGDTSH